MFDAKPCHTNALSWLASHNPSLNISSVSFLFSSLDVSEVQQYAPWLGFVQCPWRFTFHQALPLPINHMIGDVTLLYWFGFKSRSNWLSNGRGPLSIDTIFLTKLWTSHRFLVNVVNKRRLWSGIVSVLQSSYYRCTQNPGCLCVGLLPPARGS